ncbi:hypothetical protein [Streptomyces scabiei]|uniref:hypothetical protein n=1 Tax=Streptomyces scabiei TaxID=1930 RepID=UPI0037BB543F
MITTKWGSTLQTKWDLINDAERASLEKIPFGHPCTGCGEMLATEADFAKHFYVPDPIYKNLGECPIKQGMI